MRTWRQVPQQSFPAEDGRSLWAWVPTLALLLGTLLTVLLFYYFHRWGHRWDYIALQTVSGNHSLTHFSSPKIAANIQSKAALHHCSQHWDAHPIRHDGLPLADIPRQPFRETKSVLSSKRKPRSGLPSTTHINTMYNFNKPPYHSAG